MSDLYGVHEGGGTGRTGTQIVDSFTAEEGRGTGDGKDAFPVPRTAHRDRRPRKVRRQFKRSRVSVLSVLIDRPGGLPDLPYPDGVWTKVWDTVPHVRLPVDGSWSRNPPKTPMTLG